MYIQLRYAALVILVVITNLAVWNSQLHAQSGKAPYQLEKHDGGVRVMQSGELVADYVIKSKPIIYPVIGPDGVKMTRDYPMVADSENEAHDHPHHRSLWFTHGEVNHVDFWAEGDKMGITEHQEFTQLDDGKQAVIATRNIWKSAAGESILDDHRRFTFDSDDQARWIDCEIELTASRDVNFGDTKKKDHLAYESPNR
ncbi:MAG: DUF6807 family protein [Pirellulaceae bacterium]